eukprot:12752_1
MVQICNDLLLLILLFLIQPLDDGIKCAVRFAGYDANPLGSFETMLTKPGTFENIMRIDPDGHHAAYTYGYLCAVDCDGQCRIAAGHYGGSLSDIETFYYSDLYANPGIYVGNGAKYLVDGIFARIDSGPHGHFITPFCYMQRRLTVAETRYNNIQAWDRSIVEHYFGRLKYWFPLVDNFRLSDEAINMVFRSCCIFTNIMIQYCKPLRK